MLVNTLTKAPTPTPTESAASGAGWPPALSIKTVGRVLPAAPGSELDRVEAATTPSALEQTDAAPPMLLPPAVEADSSRPAVDGTSAPAAAVPPPSAQALADADTLSVSSGGEDTWHYEAMFASTGAAARDVLQTLIVSDAALSLADDAPARGSLAQRRITDYVRQWGLQMITKYAPTQVAPTDWATALATDLTPREQQQGLFVRNLLNLYVEITASPTTPEGLSHVMRCKDLLWPALEAAAQGGVERDMLTEVHHMTRDFAHCVHLDRWVQAGDSQGYFALLFGLPWEGARRTIEAMTDRYPFVCHDEVLPLLTAAFFPDNTPAQVCQKLRHHQEWFSTLAACSRIEVRGDVLYVGAVNSAMDKALLEELHITHVVNCFDDTQAHPEAQYMLLPLSDHTSEKVMHHFPKVCQFVNEALERQSEGARVLIHCQKGISRSVTMCAAVLMARHQMRAIDAVNLIKQSRRVAHPNPGFVMQLRLWEGLIFSGAISREGQFKNPNTSLYA